MAYSIAKAAKQFGVTAHTLRYYEKEGLLPFVERTSSGIREFKDSDLEWLKIIMCLKNTGMPIKDIKQYIDLAMEGDSTFEARLDFIRNHKKNVEAQLAQINKHLDLINYKEQYYTNKIIERDSK